MLWASLPLCKTMMSSFWTSWSLRTHSHTHTHTYTQVSSLEKESMSPGIQQELPLEVIFLETARVFFQTMLDPDVAFQQQMNQFKAVNIDCEWVPRLVQFARLLQVVWGKKWTRKTGHLRNVGQRMFCLLQCKTIHAKQQASSSFYNQTSYSLVTATN